jgi:hypothetical protein
MSINKMMGNMNLYFTEAMARIFGPSDDKYPKTGVQPFEGKPKKKARKSNWS